MCVPYAKEHNQIAVSVYSALFLALSGSQAQPKNQLLVLRCLANIFSLENGQQLMDYERKWVGIALLW